MVTAQDLNEPTADRYRDLAVQVGAAVKAERQRAGLTMSALARRVGVSGAFVSLLERGLTSMSIVTLYRMAQALSVTPDRLLPPLPAEPTTLEF